MSTEITNDLAWLKTHVTLLVIVIVLVLGGIYGIESIIAKQTAANASRLELILKEQNDRLAADEKNWTEQNNAQQAVIAQLSTSIAQRDKDLSAQLKKDATLTAQQSASKITQQTGAKPGEVTSNGDNVTVSLPISRDITAKLDELPVVQHDLQDTKQQLSSETTIADNRQQLIDEMKKTADAADKSCKADISNLKAQSRKSKLKWFGIGYILGLASAHFIGI